MNADFAGFLKDLLSQPTAPYREQHVRRWLAQRLCESKVPFFEDPIGNVIVGADSQKAYLKKLNQKTKEPVRLFIAHMDHPGFHGVRWIDQRRLAVRFFGGTPTKHLNGSQVWIADDAGWWGCGKLGSAVLLPSKAALKEGIVTVEKGSGDNPPKPSDLFGGFRFRKPIWQQGKLLYTKAADDLVGAGTIAWLAQAIYRANSPQRDHFLALLSRAEEVGFIGTIGHFNLGWLEKRDKAGGLRQSGDLPDSSRSDCRQGARGATRRPSLIQGPFRCLRERRRRSYRAGISGGSWTEALVKLRLRRRSEFARWVFRFPWATTTTKVLRGALIPEVN